MKKILILLVFLMIFPVVSADVIMPGTKVIQINNKITNLPDYPDYVFVSALDIDNEYVHPGWKMCSPKLVEEDGTIYSRHYKLCRISVYAVKNSDINLNEFDAKGNLKLELNETETEAYFLSLNPKKVIKNVKSFDTVSITSTKESEKVFYVVDLSQVKETPDNQEIEKNNLAYIYLGISILALVIIILILIKREKDKK